MNKEPTSPESFHPQFTLTDVMRGVHKHDLVTLLSPPCFSFLMGLILKSNELGFKNPLGLTVVQALAAGGGGSRQVLNSRRKDLAKVRLDGKPLVKVTPGVKARYSVALYEINYELLCLYNGMWQGLNSHPSRKLDGLLSDSTQNDNRKRTESEPSRKIDGSLTILRSEERREEDNNVLTVNKTTTGSKEVATVEENVVVDDPIQEEEARVKTVNDDIITLQQAILNKWHSQLTAAPSDSHCRQVLELYEIDRLLNAIDRVPPVLKGKNGSAITPASTLNTVASYAKNGSWGAPQQQAEGTYSENQRIEAQRELPDLEREYEVALADDDPDHFTTTKEAYLSQVEGQILRWKAVLGITATGE